MTDPNDDLLEAAREIQSAAHVPYPSTAWAPP